jgi:hypothetical protein
MRIIYGGYISMRAGAKETVGRLIKISDLKRKGLLRKGSSITASWTRNGVKVSSISGYVEEDGLILAYHSDGEPFQYKTPFDWTPCNYGGYRQWFLCSNCWKRTAVLYERGKYFFCRKCQNLAYESQRENETDRMMRKSQKIREQLGGSGSMIDPFPFKPKGMHWKTYWGLRGKASAYEGRSWGALAKKLNIKY